MRFSRGLREVGVPEQQADRQAELMADAFSTFADELVTRDYFSEVLDARLTQHGAELEQRIVEKMTLRFAGQDAKFESHDARFSKQDRILLLHTWMLGLITLVLVVPQLQAWLA
jgi:hypothetical protein